MKGNLLVLVLLVLLTSACSSTFDKPFTPIRDSFTVDVLLVDNPHQLVGKCIIGALGCAYCVPSGRCYLYSVKNRCVLDHEIDHLLFGFFHGNKMVSCDVRAN
jgi:hypothetical protein